MERREHAHSEIQRCLGIVLADIRITTGMTQREIAKRVDPGGPTDSHENTVRRWEKGTSWPRRLQVTLDKYAELGETTQQDLWRRALTHWTDGATQMTLQALAEDSGERTRQARGGTPRTSGAKPKRSADG